MNNFQNTPKILETSPYPLFLKETKRGCKSYFIIFNRYFEDCYFTREVIQNLQ